MKNYFVNDPTMTARTNTIRSIIKQVEPTKNMSNTFPFIFNSFNSLYTTAMETSSFAVGFWVSKGLNS